MRIRHITAFLMALVLCGVLTGRAAEQGTPPAGSPSEIVQRAREAHGGRAAHAGVLDSIADGKITLFGADGPKVTFDVTIARKGNSQVQRSIKQPATVVKQGTDGTKSWESAAGFFTPTAQGRALFFIESQTVRSIQRLFNHQTEGLTLRNLPGNGKAHLIEAEDRQGRKTSYDIDSTTSVITKLSFNVGQAKDPFSGRLVDVTDEYVFSDYRTVQGVLTPFKVERFSNGNKLEETVFASIRYNAGLKDQDFKR